MVMLSGAEVKTALDRPPGMNTLHAAERAGRMVRPDSMACALYWAATRAVVGRGGWVHCGCVSGINALVSKAQVYVRAQKNRQHCTSSVGCAA